MDLTAQDAVILVKKGFTYIENCIMIFVFSDIKYIICVLIIWSVCSSFGTKIVSKPGALIRFEY